MSDQVSDLPTFPMTTASQTSKGKPPHEQGLESHHSVRRHCTPVHAILAFTCLSFITFSFCTGYFPYFGSPCVSHELSIDLTWHPPSRSRINNPTSALSDSGTYGFIFNSSQTPSDVEYGTYNYCNMPHVRASEYPRVDDRYNLEYVEVIQRHHKRTPYASNVFPVEVDTWECDDEGLFTHGKPLAGGNGSANTYWQTYTSPSNPFLTEGFAGTCRFPQITREGLDDSWQHGRDLSEVYHTLLDFVPASYDPTSVSFRVSNNVITSQVAGMLIAGMYPSLLNADVPLLVQAPGIDSLEPSYPCLAASHTFASYGVGSKNTEWLTHLTASSRLFKSLDAISQIPPEDKHWHQSFDPYFDTLSSRLCHSHPLPCSASTSDCIPLKDAETVFRMGQYEYSYIYRDHPLSLSASVASFGVYIAELASNLRSAVAREEGVRYRHNVAHDGSLAKLLSILQVDQMVWPGKGAEVAFELYSGPEDKSDPQEQFYLRVLWGGRVLRSSSPTLGGREHGMDMIPLSQVLGYFDGLVGERGGKVIGLCEGT